MGTTTNEVGTGRVVVRETEGPGGLTVEIRVDGQPIALLNDGGQVGVFDPFVEGAPVMLMSQFVATPTVARTWTGS